MARKSKPLPAPPSPPVPPSPYEQGMLDAMDLLSKVREEYDAPIKSSAVRYGPMGGFASLVSNYTGTLVGRFESAVLRHLNARRQQGAEAQDETTP